MDNTIDLVEEPIDSAAVLASVASPRSGAVVLFLGTAREITGSRHTAALVYEAYDAMARRQLSVLAAEACRQWELEAYRIVHRLGRVPAGEITIAIAVSAAHRRAAFEAASWLIDRIKESVPIWKQECWADGTSEWVHPGLGMAAGNEPAP